MGEGAKPSPTNRFRGSCPCLPIGDHEIMKRQIALALAGVTAVATVAAAPGAERRADVDHEFELALGDTASAAGSTPVGLNVQNYIDDYSCDGSPEHSCELALIKVTNPYEEENAKKNRERANLTIAVTPDVPASDYDVLVFESDADATKGSQVGNAGGVPMLDHPESVETVNAVVTTTEDETERWFLVWIVHWSTVGSYTIDVAFDQ